MTDKTDKILSQLNVFFSSYLSCNKNVDIKFSVNNTSCLLTLNNRIIFNQLNFNTNLYMVEKAEVERKMYSEKRNKAIEAEIQEKSISTDQSKKRKESIKRIVRRKNRRKTEYNILKSTK